MILKSLQLPMYSTRKAGAQEELCRDYEIRTMKRPVLTDFQADGRYNSYCRRNKD